MKYKELQAQMNAFDKTQFNEINIAVLSNIILEPYFNLLTTRIFVEDKIFPNITPVPYEEYQSNDYTENLKQANIIMVLLNFEALCPNISNGIYSDKKETESILSEIRQSCMGIWDYLQSNSAGQVIWFGFEDYYNKENIVTGNIYLCENIVGKLNNELYDLLNGQAAFIDLKRLIAEVGIENSYDEKSKYRWNSPYSQQLIERIAGEIYKQYLISTGKTKKCIIVDCDNVLWGGILSEDGIENIKLGSTGIGRSYQDFQRFLLSMYYRGVILAVCSKNDPDDVMIMFREHSEMILREEHISCFQVNWDKKADNIRKTAEILNIGLDSIVFIDDNPFETEAVKSMLPDVTAILYDRNNVYGQLSCFNLKNNVDINTINLRNNTYKTNRLREDLKSQQTDYNDYLNALDMNITIKETVPAEYSRISELSQRANRCTNGKRYTTGGITEKIKDEGCNFYSVYVSDKFADLGLVGAIGINDHLLELICLSCRALGRNVEDKIIHFIQSKHSINDIYFAPTGKNEGFKMFLKDIVREV